MTHRKASSKSARHLWILWEETLGTHGLARPSISEGVRCCNHRRYNQYPCSARSSSNSKGKKRAEQGKSNNSRQQDKYARWSLRVSLPSSSSWLSFAEIPFPGRRIAPRQKRIAFSLTARCHASLKFTNQHQHLQLASLLDQFVALSCGRNHSRSEELFGADCCLKVVVYLRHNFTPFRTRGLGMGKKETGTNLTPGQKCVAFHKCSLSAEVNWPARKKVVFYMAFTTCTLVGFASACWWLEKKKEPILACNAPPTKGPGSVQRTTGAQKVWHCVGVCVMFVLTLEINYYHQA